MTENLTLPTDLINIAGSEKQDFAIKADRTQPLKNSLSAILMGIGWTAFTSILGLIVVGPIFQGQEVHFETNGVPTVAGPGNLGPIIGPALFIIGFILIGLLILAFGVYSLFKKGGYFIGTPTRLINYQNGKIRSIDWEQFSGDIEINNHPTKGDISLQLRTGKMVSSKNNSDKYVPDTIHISGIPNTLEIGQICRQRIKENDPTPASS